MRDNNISVESICLQIEAIKHKTDFLVEGLCAQRDAALAEANQLRQTLKIIYDMSAGHALECDCTQCKIFEVLEPIVGNRSTN